MRSGRELASIAHLLGLELGDAINAASVVPEELVNTNRDKISGKKTEGVTIVSEGTNEAGSGEENV